MGNAKPFKASSVSRASDVVAVVDINGSNDPPKLVVLPMLHGWIPFGGQFRPLPQSPTGFKHPLQTAYARHNKTLEFLLSGRSSAASLPSKITWGQFWGIFEPNVTLQNCGTA